MKTDWKEVGLKIGSLQSDGSEYGGSVYAQLALEELLGKEWIKDTVNHIIQAKPASELAMNCLRYIKSKKAALYTYEIYSHSSGGKAAEAVWLIKHIAHPISFDWIEEFIKDENVIVWGIGVLDQLLWTEAIDYKQNKKQVDYLFKLASSKSTIHKESIDFIKDYLKQREE